MSGPDKAEEQSGFSRRDFLGGVSAVATVGSLAAGLTATAMPSKAVAATRNVVAASGDAATYPPLRTGLRGQHPGSFETAHAVRDGALAGPLNAASTGEHYDLIVVGAGLSGLAAAYFYQKQVGKDRKILILDNHDDFGGHAKRNEFHHEGRIYLGAGGSSNTHSPFPYSQTALSLLAELGVDPGTASKYSKHDLYSGLKQAVFFDADHFGEDKLVPGYREKPWKEFFAATPLAEDIRADLVRLYTEKVDYMPDLSPAQKIAALQSMSYRDFLLQYAKVSEKSLEFFAGMGLRGRRVDTCPAYWIPEQFPDMPGFAGMQVEKRQLLHSKTFAFPDGNASVARLLVNRLVPSVFEGTHDMESIILARANYATLDLAANAVRIRLSSPVVRVEHIGAPNTFTEKAVNVTFMRGDKAVSATAANVVLACFNGIIRHIAPELPAEQGQAQAYSSKIPLQPTNVLVRNWRPWKELGVRSIHAPNGYSTQVSLVNPIDIGGYRTTQSPDQPVVIGMMRIPNGPVPGMNRKDQNRQARHLMLAESPEQVQAQIRSQLNRMLGHAGFNDQRDIVAMAVNRWAHGYAYSYDTLNDPDLPGAGDRPHVKGRKPFGRIAIANSDASASAFMNTAFDEAHRAITDCLTSRDYV